MEAGIEKKVHIDLLIEDIRAKRELSNLEPSFIRIKLENFLSRNKKLLEKLEKSDYKKFQRSKEHEKIIKGVRASLREVYGVFIQDDYSKRHKLLEDLKEARKEMKEADSDDESVILEAHDKILALHRSSNERLPIYALVYRKIFEITGKPKKIVDLACGLNPISYPYLGCRPEYVACDLSEKDLEFIADFFKAEKIKGGVKKIDLLNDDVSEITKGADVVFLFKALDSLETIKWNTSEEMMTHLKSKFVVVSFATKSIGGKKDIKPERRGWVEKMLKRHGWGYDEFELPGEYFYVVRMKK